MVEALSFRFLEILLQFNTVAIDVDRAGEQTDEVDQSPDAAADAGAAGQNDLDDTVSVVAQIEIVNTNATQEEAQQNSSQLGLLVNHGLARYRAGQSKAAVGADAGTRNNLIAAVLAVVEAGSLLEATLCAYSCIYIHRSATVFTIHNRIPSLIL